MRKAQVINDHALLLRIQGYSNKAIDMVACDVCYHMPCMNRYLSQREKPSVTVNTSTSTDDHMVQIQLSDSSAPYDTAFRCLVEKIQDPLFNDFAGYLLVTLRDMYREN